MQSFNTREPNFGLFRIILYKLHQQAKNFLHIDF